MQIAIDFMSYSQFFICIKTNFYANERFLEYPNENLNLIMIADDIQVKLTNLKSRRFLISFSSIFFSYFGFSLQRGK